jgi:hypothetical protein
MAASVKFKKKKKNTTTVKEKQNKTAPFVGFMCSRVSEMEGITRGPPLLAELI